jgi:hypothetical protein
MPRIIFLIAAATVIVDCLLIVPRLSAPVAAPALVKAQQSPMTDCSKRGWPSVALTCSQDAQPQTEAVEIRSVDGQKSAEAH